MRVKLANQVFALNTLWVILTLTAFAILINLSWWQLSRASEKTALQDARTQQSGKEVLDGRTLRSSPEDLAQRSGLIHRRVVVKGRWLPNNTVYLDNRQMNAKPGFFVLTPLQIEGTGEVLVVQRGWAPRTARLDFAHAATQSARQCQP